MYLKSYELNIYCVDVNRNLFFYTFYINLNVIYIVGILLFTYWKKFS